MYVGGTEGQRPIGIVRVTSETALDLAVLYVTFEICERFVGRGPHPPANMRGLRGP